VVYSSRDVRRRKMPRSAVDEVQFGMARLLADERASRHNCEFVVVEDPEAELEKTYPFVVISIETYENEYSDLAIQYSTTEE
jgi:hypothetical protein